MSEHPIRKVSPEELQELLQQEYSLEDEREVRRLLRRTRRIPFGPHKGVLVKDLPTGEINRLHKWLTQRDGFDDLREVLEGELRDRLGPGSQQG